MKMVFFEALLCYFSPVLILLPKNPPLKEEYLSKRGTTNHSTGGFNESLLTVRVQRDKHIFKDI